MTTRLDDYAPFLIGLAMVGVGLAARQVEPEALRLPKPGAKARLRDVRSGRDAARAARDGLAGLLPSNLTRSVGRTMILMGAALIAVRALDELVDDDSAEY
ncbi:hypothetical protein [Roseivivax isoporae]|uniref:Uncharacterized protein n=1 Tax=Roseivivax isoporae LMG 25204 TaxID=1449351 RepID=X7FAZ7_9RHOB|nr:hypothetical protein [Roseivivax isoporae]ETX29960.1 hypothetical protein RISW2_20135 [Roseivivax isoporae LMG 25204]